MSDTGRAGALDGVVNMRVVCDEGAVWCGIVHCGVGWNVDVI